MKNNQKVKENFLDFEEVLPKTTGSEDITFESVPVFDKPKRKRNGYDREQVDRYIKAAGKAYNKMAEYCSRIEGGMETVSKSIVDAEMAAKKITQKAEEEARALIESAREEARITVGSKSSFLLSTYSSSGGDE